MAKVLSPLILMDLFCGAGGMTQGFVDAGFQPRVAVDNDAWAVRTYRENFGDCVVHSPIEEFRSFPRVDVLIGGPPCQGFSTLGTNDPDNPLNKLWKHYLRALNESEPSAFVMENVPGLLRTDQYRRFKRLASREYDIVEVVLNAADFGIPQARRRAIVVGTRVGVAGEIVPEPTHQSPKLLPRTDRHAWLDVRSAFARIPTEPTREADAHWDPYDPKRGVELHAARNPTETSIQRYRAIPPGGNRWDLLKNRPDITPGCWVRKTDGGTDLMGRLWWDRPSVTIRTEFFKPEKGRYLHPTADRPITHWEAARLQTFPDTFAFVGSKTQVAKQIGNAVPCLLARAIAEKLFDRLEVYRPRMQRRAGMTHALA